MPGRCHLNVEKVGEPQVVFSGEFQTRKARELKATKASFEEIIRDGTDEPDGTYDERRSENMTPGPSMPTSCRRGQYLYRFWC